MVSRLEKITPTQLWYQDLVAVFYLSKFKVMGVKQIFNSFDTEEENDINPTVFCFEDDHEAELFVTELQGVIDIYKSINKK